MNFKKSLKGMTLYEMIIAIAIFAIMTGILVGIGNHIDRANRATRNLKSRIVREAPYAANKVTFDQETLEPLDSVDVQIDVSVDLKDTNKLDVTLYNEKTKKFYREAYNYPTSVSMSGKKYQTEDKFSDEEADKATAKSIYSGLNLEFVNIDSLEDTESESEESDT